MLDIRDRWLYRKQGYTAFDDYCPYGAVNACGESERKGDPREALRTRSPTVARDWHGLLPHHERHGR